MSEEEKKKISEQHKTAMKKDGEKKRGNKERFTKTWRKERR